LNPIGIGLEADVMTVSVDKKTAKRP